jgi:hypothetical protein
MPAAGSSSPRLTRTLRVSQDLALTQPRCGRARALVSSSAVLPERLRGKNETAGARWSSSCQGSEHGVTGLVGPHARRARYDQVVHPAPCWYWHARPTADRRKPRSRTPVFTPPHRRRRGTPGRDGGCSRGRSRSGRRSAMRVLPRRVGRQGRRSRTWSRLRTTVAQRASGRRSPVPSRLARRLARRRDEQHG